MAELTGRDEVFTIDKGTIAALLKMVQEVKSALMEHMINETATVRELHEAIARLEKRAECFISGFPNGDPRPHRKYHETVIAREAAKTLFYQKLLFELSKYGLIGFAAWLIYQGWKGFLQGPTP